MWKNEWLQLLKKESFEARASKLLASPQAPSFVEFPIGELPHARAWVRKAIKERLIPQGSILEVVYSKRLRFGAILLYSSEEERTFLLRRIGLRPEA